MRFTHTREIIINKKSVFMIHYNMDGHIIMIMTIMKMMIKNYVIGEGKV